MIKVRLLDETGREFYGNGWPRGGVEYSHNISVRARGGPIKAKSLQYYWFPDGYILTTLSADKLEQADDGGDFAIIHG